MNKLREDSKIVLMILSSISYSKQTLKIAMSYDQILEGLIALGYEKDFNIKKIKYLVEYMSEIGWITYRNDPLYPEICITAAGIDEYYNNFK